MTDPLDELEARLSWRIQGAWERIENHGARGVETVDRQGRRLRVFPASESDESEAEEGYFGTVKYVGERGHYRFRGAQVGTGGPTPEAVVRRGCERLEARLEEIAERRKGLEAPDLTSGVSGASSSSSNASSKSSNANSESSNASSKSSNGSSKEDDAEQEALL